MKENDFYLYLIFRIFGKGCEEEEIIKTKIFISTVRSSREPWKGTGISRHSYTDATNIW